MKKAIVKLVIVLCLSIPLTVKATSYSPSIPIQDKYILNEIIKKIKGIRKIRRK